MREGKWALSRIFSSVVAVGALAVFSSLSVGGQSPDMESGANPVLEITFQGVFQNGNWAGQTVDVAILVVPGIDDSFSNPTVGVYDNAISYARVSFAGVVIEETQETNIVVFSNGVQSQLGFNVSEQGLFDSVSGANPGDTFGQFEFGFNNTPDILSSENYLDAIGLINSFENTTQGILEYYEGGVSHQVLNIDFAPGSYTVTNVPSSSTFAVFAIAGLANVRKRRK